MDAGAVPAGADVTTRVVAVVVTYNRAEQLAETLRCIYAQTHDVAGVVVVDNASTDSTGDVLRAEPRVQVIRNPVNTGGAGGFSTGLLAALETESDAFWLMDDDCFPSADALEKLVVGRDRASAAAGRQVPFACSLVLWTDGTLCGMNNPATTWDWSRLIVEGERAVLVANCSFVSVLIPRWAVTRHGLPLAEYFIWFDDVEYTQRLSAAEGPGVQILDSRVTHAVPDNKGVNFGYVTADNIWKYEYGARNGLSMRYRKASKVHSVVFFYDVLAQMRDARVPARLQWRVVRALVRGFAFNPQAEPLPSSVRAEGVAETGMPA